MKPHLSSMNDIAKALGVSVSTVSRALKDHPDISITTTKRVKAFAEKINYRPNALALSLKLQTSKTIGIIIPEIVHHFFSSIISGIEDIAYNSGYRVMICQTNDDFRREEINTQALLDHRVDGLLVCISKTTTNYDHLKSVYKSQTPMVFLDRVCSEIETDRVTTDDFNGARMVTAHLIEMGCKRILYLGTKPQLLIGQDRQQGYLQALRDHNIPVETNLIIKCDTPGDVATNKDYILSVAKNIDGIFAVNDFTAVAVMSLLKEEGYHIPKDIAIAGFGDDPIAIISDPPLTTVEQKGFQMGQDAMNMLMNRLNNPDAKRVPISKVFSVELKIRKSTNSKLASKL